MKAAISVRNLSKQYKLGLVHTDLLSEKLGDRLRAVGNLFKHGSARQRIRASKADDDLFWALKDVSFEVLPGEVMGVIGRNGAGKSTLLKILSRITSPTTGEVNVQGRLASLLEVGTGFHPELTGRENVFLNGAILGMQRSEVTRKFAEVVEFAGIEKFIDTPVKRYSSGMYVRLAFAVAAHLEPDVLVVDEVLAVGDAEFQKRCLGKLKDVSTSGRTVMFVSHNLSSLRKLCDSGLLLKGGIVHFQGKIDDALSTYLSMARSEHGDEVLSMPRPAWATPLISSVALNDSFGNRIKECPQGGDLAFIMTFESSPEYPVNQPVMGIVIKNALGEIVGGVNNRMTATPFKGAASGPMTFKCKLLTPPLLQGTYLVDFWLGDGTIDIDVLEDVLEFSVVEMDVYDSGVSPFAHMGNIYLNPVWSLSRS